ncbi:MAG TPA: protein kinase [Candidatus Eisenbergiella stercorigallinarum]|uniref:Protein kinase n=1 Tax=Candidatus Eisenbergiella stercorigallinarum TaxID=2838557 RepID=A0A9D2QYR7_9FIRM|nr:protein kinase [Candidatus Eisenbergiella stercorigallinarum]
MADRKNFCPGCMREWEENIRDGKAADTGTGGRNEKISAGQRCPYCGFSEAEYQQNPRCLPLNTILAGKYLVGKVLGEGGFGITYMGYDLNMKARIAIKEYFPVELVSRDTTRLTSPDGKPVSGDRSDRVISLSGEKSKTCQQGLKKYVDEARNVSQFADIPGIVSVKDFFYENNTAYIVMEYIEGISLKEYLKQRGGKLSEEEALAILRPVLEALKKVHAAGIVHRDISPDNIMLTFTGKGEAGAGQSDISAVYGNISAVKLIDFGAARMTSKNDQKSLTIILKHGYAPEEQYRSHGEQGPWTDVYALCAVLYRMLTGKVPEPAMDRLFSDNLKRPEELGVKVSPAVSEAIMRGLAVKKEDRIQSVRELMDALDAGKKIKKAGQKEQRRIFTMAALAAGMLVLVVAAAGIGMTFWTEKDRNIEEKDMEQAEMSAQSGQNLNVSQAAGKGQEGNFTASEETQGDPVEAVGEELSLEQETEEIGEALVTRTPQTAMASGNRHMVAMQEDGTVKGMGVNTEGQLEVEDWKRIAAVAAGRTFSAGLREDGTLVIAGELEAADEVERWENVVEIAAEDTTLFALTADGTILSNEKYGETGAYYEWKDIAHIACSNYCFSALTRDGTVLNEITRENIDFGSPARIEGWTDVKHLIVAQYAVFGITEEGDVRSALILDAVPETSYDFTGIESFHDITAFYSDGGFWQFGVREDGSLCVAGRTEDAERRPLLERVEEWKELQSFTGVDYRGRYVGLKKDGSLVTDSLSYGNSTPETMENLEWITFLDGQDLAGVTRDGKALTFSQGTDIMVLDGISEISQVCSFYGFSSGIHGYLCLDQNGRMIGVPETPGEAAAWEGLSQIVTPWTYGDFAAGLFQDGTVRVLLPEEQGERMGGLRKAEEWTGIKQLACAQGSIFGLREDGSVQALMANGAERELPDEWIDIAAIFSGPDVGAVRKDGTAVIDQPEDNEYGQKNVSGWENLTQLALSESHTVGLRADGTVVAVGSNTSGQCDVEDWTDIVYVAASNDCTLGIRADGTLAIAGAVGW